MLGTRVSTVVNPDSDTLEVTAIDPNAQRATLLADTFSEELIASLTTKELDEYTKSVDAASERLASAQRDRDRLLQQVLGNPQDQFTQSQYAAAASIYGSRVSQFLTLQNTGAPTPAVSTLEPAQAVPIGSGEYDALLSAGESGRNHFQAAGETNTFVTPSSGSSFDDPVSRGVLGGLLGLLAGVGLALVADRLDRRLRYPAGRGDRVRAPGARRSAEAHQCAATSARPRLGLVAALRAARRPTARCARHCSSSRPRLPGGPENWRPIRSSPSRPPGPHSTKLPWTPLWFSGWGFSGAV